LKFFYFSPKLLISKERKKNEDYLKEINAKFSIEKKRSKEIQPKIFSSLKKGENGE